MHNWIKELQLERHIEGGYFSKSYLSEDKVITLSERYHNSTDKDAASIRKAGSAIYFLLEKQDFSAWHKLKSDEVWHFYDGSSAIIIHRIDKNGNYTQNYVGNPRLDAQAKFQVLIPSETWFSAELINTQGYALVGCTVSPGFEYQDFILADRDKLTDKYPQHTKIIKRLTHEKITADLSN